MSAVHPWLRFTAAGPALPTALAADPGPWQRALSAQHARWYDGVAPPAVAAVFVLQWLLQVPAHTAATAATAGPWRVEPLRDLTVTLGPALVPEEVRLPGVAADPRAPADRLSAAEDDYRQVAEPLAREYPAPVRIGPRTRSGLVEDMWTEAVRVAAALPGPPTDPPPRRLTCCLIYALPGCHECAGCPRIPAR